MSHEKTFTRAEIDSAIEYLLSLDFNRPLDREIEGRMLFIRQASTENVSITVLILSNNSIRYDVSSSGGDEDYPVETGEINSLEQLRVKVAEVIG
ncbi:hypothetical protein NIES4071_48330 [Calothrix sp. NIES-4071]|nr:hypothetical protein NIES4071_48330 [Calothrix sp. NIES-4071]BAZ59145.1 hypothetical protein NIES4105_48270 [Calothrix sp. NIES-4105]